MFPILVFFPIWWPVIWRECNKRSNKSVRSQFWHTILNVYNLFPKIQTKALANFCDFNHTFLLYSCTNDICPRLYCLVWLYPVATAIHNAKLKNNIRFLKLIKLGLLLTKPQPCDNYYHNFPNLIEFKLCCREETSYQTNCVIAVEWGSTVEIFMKLLSTLTCEYSFLESCSLLCECTIVFSITCNRRLFISHKKKNTFYNHCVDER